MNQIILGLLLLSSISACATQEHLVRVSDQEKAKFTCKEIATELKAAEDHRNNISVNLEPTDPGEAIILIPLMMIEHLDANNATENAELRIEDLEVLKIKKGCSKEPVS